MSINKFFSWVKGLIGLNQQEQVQQQVSPPEGMGWIEADDLITMDEEGHLIKVNEDKEVVLVVEEATISKLSEGKTTFMRGYAEPIFLTTQWMHRDEAETDPAYRQVIPYVLLRTGKKYWVYDRTTEGGEGRLHGLSSLGWGGHINPEDAVTPIPDDAVDYIFLTADSCVDRELTEELGLSEPLVPSKQTDLGMIVSYDSPVDLVHLGLVSIWDVPAPEALELKLDPSVGNLRLMTLTQLRAEKQSFESWSQIVINQLNSKV